MELIEDLGDGLVLRRATAADTEALVAFNADIHREPGDEGPNPFITAWVRDLTSGAHPTFDIGDFTIVEDSRTGAIVSSLNLISQTWSYGGLPFGVGRIELVGTRPDHRRRGLVRRQMAVAHRWSSERGELVQGITGIPHYYRRFGYEMALDHGAGRTGYLPHVPDLPTDSVEGFRVRPATVADIPFIASLDEQARSRSLVSAVRDGSLWRYELEGRHEERYRSALRIVERADGRPAGYVIHPGELWSTRLFVEALEMEPGAPWLAATPSMLRYLRTTGETYQEQPGSRRFEGFTFSLGTEHPVYRAIPDRLPRIHPPYAWYLRVPDLPRFLRHLAPVLEARLAASVAASHSGDLLLGFYGDGLRLSFSDGRLASTEAWKPPDDERGGASFPELTFLQILFGYRSLSELEHAFADCRVNTEEARVLLDALFPKQPSHIWPVQ